jgi:endonuclease YncB( thermonuclease family)
VEFQQRVVTVKRTRDGDTYEVDVRLTPRITEAIVGRLQGFDCPESKRPASDFEIGKSHEALNIAIAFLNSPGALWCRRELKTDSFGRELVTLWHVVDEIQTDLGETLFGMGLATRWPTRWHEVYDPLRQGPVVTVLGMLPSR